MRYFIDTEFIEDGLTIDLISIGIVCEDGREYYALNYDCNHSKADDWVKKNVLAQLPEQPLPFLAATAKDAEKRRNGYYNKESIAIAVAEFCGCTATLKPLVPGEMIYPSRSHNYALKPESPKPEFWAYYADYDWVAFCQLFGRMVDLPNGFPMYCNDIKQECDRLGNPMLPKQTEGFHNALEDAKWNRRAWSFLSAIAELGQVHRP